MMRFGHPASARSVAVRERLALAAQMALSAPDSVPTRRGCVGLMTQAG